MSLKYPSFRTFNLSSLHESTKGWRNYFMPDGENWWIVSSHQFGASSGTGYLMLFAWIFFLTLTKGCLISGFQCTSNCCTFPDFIQHPISIPFSGTVHMCLRGASSRACRESPWPERIGELDSVSCKLLSTWYVEYCSFVQWVWKVLIGKDLAIKE